jgi:SAM-dependent methyltransferase
MFRSAEEHNRYQRAYYQGCERQAIRPSGTPYVQRQLERVRAAADLRSGQEILEIGCGMGRHTLPLLEEDFRIAACDLSPDLLARLRKAAPNAKLEILCCDVAELPRHTTRRFDRAVGFFTLHHFFDLRAAFRGIASVLQPGGRVAFCEPNGYNPLFYVQIAVVPGMTWKGDGGVRHMRPSVVHGAMREAGFADLRVERFGFLPAFAADTKVGQSLERGLDRFVVLPPLRALQVFQALQAFQIFSGTLVTGRQNGDGGRPARD